MYCKLLYVLGQTLSLKLKLLSDIGIMNYEGRKDKFTILCISYLFGR